MRPYLALASAGLADDRQQELSRALVVGGVASKRVFSAQRVGHQKERVRLLGTEMKQLCDVLHVWQVVWVVPRHIRRGA
eukprot:365715-Chlamydomonas_euryale.AAC.1